MTIDDKTVVAFRKPTPQRFTKPAPGGRTKEKASDVPQQSVPALENSLVRPSDISSPSELASNFNQPSSLENEQGSRHAKLPENSLGTHTLINGAMPLFQSLAQLKKPTLDLNPQIFRDNIIRQFHYFEQHCRRADIGEETRHYARYLLATVVDELVIKSSIGQVSGWSRQSLLSQFHGETEGGERFFQILTQLQQMPARNIALLELIYVCLSLGFEGMYHLKNNGQHEIDQLRDNLFHLIRLQQGEPERDLSVHWQGISDQRNPLIRYVPFWVVAVVSAGLLVSLYGGFSWLLDTRAEAIVARLSTLNIVNAPPLSEAGDHE